MARVFTFDNLGSEESPANNNEAAEDLDFNEHKFAADNLNLGDQYQTHDNDGS